MAERIIEIDRLDNVAGLFGSFDANMRVLEEEIGVRVVNRESELKLTGEEPDIVLAETVLRELLAAIAKGEEVTPQNVRYMISAAKEGAEKDVRTLADDVLCITASGKPIKPKTLGQKKYINSIKKNTITLGVGPAGTGKTYLAVAAAVAYFRDRRVSRIILTRPAVEAGEKLGFLPGDLQNKVDPYLRPLYDGLFEMFGPESYAKNLERGLIEVAPLAYMRGRTLDDSFIILDEAQNTTKEQMKMFLTRIGFGSKVVITGDITQIDLPADKVSGLKDAIRILDGLDDVATCMLTSKDVVRHELVQRIIEAYEKAETKAGPKKKPAPRRRK
ncbi:PhoH family protein [Oscillospiraceae bacterium OttesenSCG-928-G22]|nr:PhoH family protein [Oscillospiraceae bacterium OttesenSCG-928-G22]